MSIWTIIGWIATGLSFYGIVLNSKKRMSCWPVWLASNAFWMALGVSYKDSAMIVSQVGFIILNVYGWRAWIRERSRP